ncbi:hypothetical protein NDU88_003244 [Pleurodeles waltl]|uniref:Uncharacterized protein n=1 Tax=Pleurodeles waltl TaxID=8319 RepID=A0AAV7MQ06_PLEWA|nr:hypothetical protein NDU88_003244 [Pleurodeles waltl]
MRGRSAVVKVGSLVQMNRVLELRGVELRGVSGESYGVEALDRSKIAPVRDCPSCGTVPKERRHKWGHCALAKLHRQRDCTGFETAPVVGFVAHCGVRRELETVDGHRSCAPKTLRRTLIHETDYLKHNHSVV